MGSLPFTQEIPVDLALTMDKIGISSIVEREYLDIETPLFVDAAVRQLSDIGIDVSDFFLDHICYRCATESEYSSVKSLLFSLGELLVEQPIAGRLISTFKLYKPIVSGNRFIPLVELPAPKRGSDYQSGLEHVEFVLPAEVSLNEYMKMHPSANWDQRGINKPSNPDIRLDFEGYSIKFHKQPLEIVIANELIASKSLEMQ